MTRYWLGVGISLALCCVMVLLVNNIEMLILPEIGLIRMMEQFEMRERGTDNTAALTVIVAGSTMTLIGPMRQQVNFFVPRGLQPEVLRTMRRKDPERLGRLLDELEAVNS